ncbi:hypothetical protein P43SY_001906 [Pythium insidiosum]|uniref:AGC protein kinase n=1 Tax=Pythium insidiosum TaxID=114742 RepID=A0AAD5LF09_PYTIN|nr:hypothetical protein P43SY_001906 [Pythium insidiosum]
MAHVLGDSRMYSGRSSISSGASSSGRPFSRRKSVGSSSMLSSSLPSQAPKLSAQLSSSSTRSTSSTHSSNALSGHQMSTPNLIDLKTISAEEVEWEGYLYKQRKIVKNWTPRYITLQNRTITVYKSKAHALAKEPTRGKWVVHQLLTTLPSTGFGGSKLQPDVLGFSVLATNGNLIHFIATSLAQKNMWLYMMRLALQRASAETASLLPAPAKQPLIKTRSTDDSQSAECAITKHLADRFLVDLMELLSITPVDAVCERLPAFLRQLSKDVELWFDLETAEVSQPSCVFKGVYHGREGFVHFLSLFITKYQLAKDLDGEPVHRAEDDDHHGFACMHQLLNTVSGSSTTGKFSLHMTFTPAKRVSRVVLSFRQRSANGSTSSAAAKSVKRVQANPVAISEHAACFHQAFLSKRSLALSFTDFDVVGVLGQGGFGTVVLVKRHLSQDEYFAIKIIDKHSGAESALKERRILSGVRHPFLVCLRFAFQTQTKLYLGLDYYKGGNLYHHMHTSKMDPNISTSRGRRLEVERARFYAAELAIALSYLHSHGIIYRDLKPDNIMLDKFGHIRLVDFGISKQLRPDESGSSAFEPTGTLAGSPAYIAPEQLLTQKPQYGMEADWWSYGVLLYEMLTGATPFHDANISQMYKKIQTAEVRYDCRPPIDEQAVDLLQKLLVRDPTERVGMAEIMAHPFFSCIDWVKMEAKEVEPPFIPPSEELMQNVHDHFRNMKVEESIGEMDAKNGKKMPTLTVKDQSHFDEFSFAFDTTRATFDGLSMADDGWLMRQLAEGAVMRGRLKSAADEVGAEDVDASDSHPNSGSGSDGD